MPAVTEADVRRLYDRFRKKYFADAHLPEWGEFDFRWTRSRKHSAFVDVGPKTADVRFLELNQKNAWSQRAIAADLLHEMTHMQGEPFLTHGPAFWSEVERLHRLGAAKEYF